MPAFFDDIAIVRDPQYNVATWNLTHRRATGTAPFEIEINGRPLVFYHFSGFDSGAQKIMLERYGADSPVLFAFRDWYIARCEELGQSALSRIPCAYSTFSNGQPITNAHRLLYRRRDDLMAAFPDPFDASRPDRSYFHWFQSQGARYVVTDSSVIHVRPLRQLIKRMPRNRPFDWLDRHVERCEPFRNGPGRHRDGTRGPERSSAEWQA